MTYEEAMKLREQVTYKITSFDKYTGRLEVEYNRKIKIALLLPIDINHMTLEGDNLKNFILDMAPYQDIQRLLNNEAIEASAAEQVSIKNADQILALVEAETDTTIDPVLDVDLDSAKSYAIQKVDSTVNNFREQFMTNIAGQAMTYIVKAKQAHEYKDSGYLNDPPPYIHYDAISSGRSPREVAEEIVAADEAWFMKIDPQIEGARIASRRKIRSANTNVEVDSAMRISIGVCQKLYMKLMEQNQAASVSE